MMSAMLFYEEMTTRVSKRRLSPTAVSGFVADVDMDESPIGDVKYDYGGHEISAPNDFIQLRCGVAIINPDVDADEYWIQYDQLQDELDYELNSFTDAIQWWKKPDYNAVQNSFRAEQWIFHLLEEDVGPCHDVLHLELEAAFKAFTSRLFTAV